MNNNDFSTAKKVIMFIVFAPIFIFGFSAIVMWLWNALLPDILGVKEVTYWQAMGLLVLSKILFGGLGDGMGKEKSNHSGPKKNFRQKWRNMSEEEREHFREQWRKRCNKDID